VGKSSNKKAFVTSKGLFTLSETNKRAAKAKTKKPLLELGIHRAVRRTASASHPTARSEK